MADETNINPENSPELEDVNISAENSEPVPEEGLQGAAIASAEIEALQQQLADAKDQVLRTAAESENIRRRAHKDIENARKFALEKFASELLPVVDNLERSLEVAESGDKKDKALVDGVALTLKSFLDVLKKHQIEQIDPIGEPFDPQLHQAMTLVESPDCEPNTVLTVMQKGFVLNDRLLRPAMVVVSKAH